MARGPRKPRLGKGRGRVPRHNERNRGGRKRRLLDMRRQNYFRFDLDDLLDEVKIGENRNVISATIQNKLMIKSLDDAMEYVDSIREDNNMTEETVDKLRVLMERYSRWR